MSGRWAVLIVRTYWTLDRCPAANRCLDRWLLVRHQPPTPTLPHRCLYRSPPPLPLPRSSTAGSTTAHRWIAHSSTIAHRRPDPVRASCWWYDSVIRPDRCGSPPGLPDATGPLVARSSVLRWIPMLVTRGLPATYSVDALAVRTDRMRSLSRSRPRGFRGRPRRCTARRRQLTAGKTVPNPEITREIGRVISADHALPRCRIWTLAALLPRLAGLAAPCTPPDRARYGDVR